MTTLQNKLSYQGDISKSPVKNVDIVFSIPEYEYSLEKNGDAEKVSRTIKGYSTERIRTDIGARSYQLTLPSGCIIDDGGGSVSNFIRYLGQSFVSISRAEQSESRDAIAGDDLTPFTVSIGVQYLSSEKVFGTQTLEGLLFLKYDGQLPRVADRSVSITSDQLERALLLMNKGAFESLREALFKITLREQEAELFSLVCACVEFGGDRVPRFSKTPSAISAEALQSRFSRYFRNPADALSIIESKFSTLFDFPLQIPELKAVRVAGKFSIQASDNVAIESADLYFYDLSIRYNDAYASPDAAPTTVLHLDWADYEEKLKSGSLEFSFDSSSLVLQNSVEGSIHVQVAGFDGTALWSKDYSVEDPELGRLNITVSKIDPVRLTLEKLPVDADKRKRIRGQIIEPTKKCALEEMTVVIQAKLQDDKVWKIVGAANADKAGYFSINYPYGAYVEAQAIVSAAPNQPAGIVIKSDERPDQTISDDFLYLLVSDVKCENKDHEEGCECSGLKKSPRLPDFADLINSDEYSQDIGGSCVNLSTPNRTLSEHNYKAIVRTSDPDVANYTLKKTDRLVRGKDYTVPYFELTGGTQIVRRPVGLKNPIRWQDAPDSHQNLSLYQAVTVATGHILHYKSVFKADGYSLGNLLYSLALAPGQKKEIVVFDSSHTLQGAESQKVSQGDRLAASLIDDRQIGDQLGGNIDESMRGKSTASTSGVSAGLGIGAILGPVGGVLGVSGGTSTASSSASQSSSRDVAQYFGEQLRQSIMQNAEGYRQLNASVVTTVKEGQQYAATSEVVANHNHCHALTMMYFEVLRHYAIYQELSSVDECIFVPLLMTNFTTENIYKWRDVLATHLLSMPSLTYLRNSHLGQHPLLKAFDANERIKTNYANVDFPLTSYGDEKILFVKGEITLRTNLPRPKTRYDRIKSLPITTSTVSHEVFDAKGAVTAVLTAGLFGSPTTTVTEDVLVRARIFDAFMQLDDNFQTVPPARCIRVTSFQPTSFTLPGGQSIPISGANFFENGIIDQKTWTSYSKILGYSSVFDMLDYYFSGRLIAEWDDIYYNDMAPVIFDKIVNNLNLTTIAADFTSTSRYKGKEVLMHINIEGHTGLKRNQFPEFITLKSSASDVSSLKDLVTLTVQNVKINYATAHYHGPLFSGYVGDDLLDGTKLDIPENSEEKRNPRKEDIYLVNKLIEHLNSNIEHYNKALWQKLDHDRRFMLLDGFNIQVFNDFGKPAGHRSLASVVKNELVTITGNSLVFPVAAGYRVSQSYILENSDRGRAAVSLMDHYQPVTPVEPYRISVPSRGVFAEAVQGACNACEKIQSDRVQDWNRFPNTDEPTPIGVVTPPTPQITDWKAAFKDLATPIVNIQNAPATPAPGEGLTGLSELLGKAGIFKDITGLDGNQQNAIKTYLSNQENAKAFADMAKGMAMQAHNTEHSDKIMDSLNAAKSSGALSQDDYGKLVKAHMQQQIDGGDSIKAEADKEKSSKPTLTDAAVKAASKGKEVKAQKTDADGNTESVEIKSGSGDNVLAEVVGVVPAIKQPNDMACWAASATMMMSWKKKQVLTITGVLASAGAVYVDKFNGEKGLTASEKDAFIAALGLVAEAPANYPLQQYIDWVKTFGPLWITTDSNQAAGQFAAHARILIKVTGSGDADGTGTDFVFIDPATGTQTVQTFGEFVSAFEQIVTDNSSQKLFTQIVHFASKIADGSDGPSEGQNYELKRVPSDIRLQIETYSTYSSGTTTKKVADYIRSKLTSVWSPGGGIVGMMFSGENSALLEYLSSEAIPADYKDAAAKAVAQANASLGGSLAATFRFEDNKINYCVVQFKKETDEALAKNYFARLAHEICHYILQESSSLILNDTRDFLFEPSVAAGDRALGAKAREAFVNETLGRRLNYLVHDEIDAVDNPGTVTSSSLGKSCYQFAESCSGTTVDYYKPIGEFLGKFSTEKQRRNQIGIWLQTFWSKSDLFDDATFTKKIKDEFNFAGEFLKTATDADYAAETGRGIQ